MAEHGVVGAVTAGISGEDTLDMWYGYISRQYSIDIAQLLLKRLYIHQFMTARDRGLSKAEAEVDTTDLVLSSLLN